MRGEVARLTYEECVEWGARAIRWCEDRAITPTERNMRPAFAALGSPFKTCGAVMMHHGKQFADYRIDCRAAVSSSVAKKLPAVAPVVQLGPGVVANAPPVLDPAVLLQELQDRHDRYAAANEQEVYRTVTISLDRPDEPVAVICMGDLHLGSPQTNPRDVIAVAQACESTTAKVFALSIGDVLDAPIKPKLIEEAWKTTISPEEEIAAAVMILDRIASAGRLLAVNAGNHDLFSQKLAGYSHLDVAMGRLSREVPYARYEMILTVELAHKGKVLESYVIELRHKFRGGGIYPAAAGIRHMNTNHRDVDAVVAGHTHSTGQAELERFGKRRHVVQLGSYKGRGQYDTEHGFQHNNLYPDRTLVLWPNRHKVEVLETERGIATVEEAARGRRVEVSRSVQKRDRFTRRVRGRNMNGRAAHGKGSRVSTSQPRRVAAVAHARRLRSRVRRSRRS